MDRVIIGMTEELTTVGEAIKKGKEFAKDGNKEIVDEYNNHLTIPQGFHIVKHGEDNVEYNYSQNENNIPTVQDGIVVEDEDGNQFVWIPVGKINNKEESEEKTTKIILGRYIFGSDGTPSEAYNGSDVINNYYIEENRKEHEISEYGNRIAKDIEKFKTSANEKNGYYIARYEAGKGSDGKPISKKGAIWNYITMPNSSIASQKMYDSTKFESDLINSYAWDTAILFIQEYSGNNNYATLSSKNTTGPLETGERNGTNDKVCNIYDIASNVFEWTTETYKDKTYPCAGRGGVYTDDRGKAGIRTDYSGNNEENVNTGFRVILYIS